MRSLALILVAASLVLSAPNLYANGSQNQEPRNKQTSPPLRIQPESHTDKNEPQAQNHPPPPASVSFSSESKANTNKNEPTKETKWWADMNWSGWAQTSVGAIGVVVVWLTLLAIRDQVLANRRTADAALISVILTREEFISTHRPKMIVRGISISNDVIEFAMINIGATIFGFL